MKKTLFLFELPPPVHGMTYTNDIIYKEYKGDERVDFVDLNFSSQVSDINVFSLKKILLNIGLVFKTWRYAFKPKFNKVYYLLSMTRFGIIRDVMILFPSLLLRKKIFLHLHGSTIIETHANSKLYRFFFNRILKGNSTFIALGKQHQEVLEEKLPFFRGRMFFINNTIIEHHTPVEIKTPKSNIKLLYLSNLHSKKGVLEIIDAMKHLDDFELTIAGAYFDITPEFFAEKLKTENLEQKINYVGVADEAMKKNLFAESDIFVLPSRLQEGSPISIIEAMSYGLPVVSTIVGCIPEMITGCGELMEQNYDGEKLVQSIKKVSENLSQYSKNALQQYQQNYANSVFFESIEEKILR